MPKYLAVLVLISVVLAFPAFAQTGRGNIETRTAPLRQVEDNERLSRTRGVLERLCALPRRQVALWNSHLQTMTAILNRVEEKGGSVDRAREAVATAQAAVDRLQNFKCTVDSGDSDSVRMKESLGQQWAEIAKQIRTTHQLITAARQAVRQAIQTIP